MSYLPAELSPEVIREFGLSIFLRSGFAMKDEVELKFVDFISSFLSNSNRRCAVFESLWRTDDLGLATEEIPYFICEKSVYYCLQFQDLTYIRKALQSARQYPFVGALISQPKTTSEITSHQTVTSDILELLAVNANSVLVGAYDGEGFLVWQKHEVYPEI